MNDILYVQINNKKMQSGNSNQPHVTDNKFRLLEKKLLLKSLSELCGNKYGFSAGFMILN